MIENLSFLVVDDNVHMRRLVRSMLHGYGSRRVHEAEDGAEGLEACQTFAPDILITDWALPIFDGIELVRMIRNPDRFKTPYIPIIMLTAYPERQRVLAARDAGVTEFLCKPISAKALHDRIRSVALNPRPFIQTRNYFGPDRRRFRMPNFPGAERRAGNMPGMAQDGDSPLLHDRWEIDTDGPVAAGHAEAQQ